MRVPNLNLASMTLDQLYEKRLSKTPVQILSRPKPAFLHPAKGLFFYDIFIFCRNVYMQSKQHFKECPLSQSLYANDPDNSASFS